MLKPAVIGFVAVVGLLVAAAIVYLMILGVQSRDMTPSLGVEDGRLRTCPPTPSCVSSDADQSDSHHIRAITDASGETWARLIDVVGALAGAQLVAASEDYAHFTFTSRLFGFVDDVEFHYRPDVGEIAVRSASRVGRGDLDANRKRVEAIRVALR